MQWGGGPAETLKLTLTVRNDPGAAYHKRPQQHRQGPSSKASPSAKRLAVLLVLIDLPTRNSPADTLDADARRTDTFALVCEIMHMRT